MVNQCTNDIAVAVIALVVAATSLVQILIVYFRTRTLIQLVAQSKVS